MGRLTRIGVALIAVAAVVGASCGGSSKKDPTSTAVPASPTPATKVATANPATQAALFVPTLMPVGTSLPNNKTYTAAQGQAIVDAATLQPADIESDWVVMNNVVTDNAAAAAADPSSAASIQRCGRLVGRVQTSQPPDVVGAFITGVSVAMFSSINVYETDAGAADCANEAATKLSQPGGLAKLFGGVFVDPNAVTVETVDYPQVADGSFAANLTGKIDANGTVVDLSILVVGFRKGNVSVAIGTAHAAGAIDTKELTPFINLTLQRLSANQ